MTQIPDHGDSAVHNLFERLFDVEPPHRPGMADASIAYGGAAARRRGYTVAGATLGVVAVAAGAVAVAREGGTPGTVSPGHVAKPAPAYEDAKPTYTDKIREIHTELPQLLAPLLPAGMTLSTADMMSDAPDALTGRVAPRFTLRTKAGEGIFTVMGNNLSNGAEDSGAAPVAVNGGTVLVTTRPADPAQNVSSSTAFEYEPTDRSKAAVRFTIAGFWKAPLDLHALVTMANAPGFQTVVTLLDPARPASAAAVRQRYQIEDRIAAETAGVLPPGFRLKCSPAIPYLLELVGPAGVNSFEWGGLSSDDPDKLPSGTLLYHAAVLGTTIPYQPVEPDGKPRMGVYGYSVDGTKAGAVFLDVLGKPVLSMSESLINIGNPDFETAPEGPGLTPQQALAIITAPGAAQALNAAQKEVWQ